MMHTIHHRIKNLQTFSHVRNWYGKFERPLSSLSLIGGFVFDAVALQRVDMFWENFWVIVHLLIVAICIILIHRKDRGIDDEKNPEKIHFWLVNVLQFFFGGILSTYLVFYFRSGSLAVSWPFLLLLGFAFWANESFKRRYVRLSFQIALFYLSLFAFSIFFVPVIVHQIGTKIFLLSGFVSLFYMAVFLIALDYFTHTKLDKNKQSIFTTIGVIFVVMNVLYFTNLIPPIPLSLKDAGIYHSISKNSAGDYILQSEVSHWWYFFEISPDIHVQVNDPVYVYSAIFSPAQLNTTIIHHWEEFNEQTKKWNVVGDVSLYVVGGRNNGFRTYSMEAGLSPGRYRVNVDTPSGQTLGTIRFTVVASSTELVLKTEVK
jgi:hypothetical protein